MKVFTFQIARQVVGTIWHLNNSGKNRQCLFSTEQKTDWRASRESPMLSQAKGDADAHLSPTPEYANGTGGHRALDDRL